MGRLLVDPAIRQAVKLLHDRGVARLASQRNVDRFHVAVEADGNERDGRRQKGEGDLGEIDNFLPGYCGHELFLKAHSLKDQRQVIGKSRRLYIRAPANTVDAAADCGKDAENRSAKIYERKARLISLYRIR